MNLNSKKSLTITMHDSLWGVDGRYHETQYVLSSNDIILSAYSVNYQSTYRNFFLLTTDSNLKGTITGESGVVDWNPGDKTTSLFGLSQAGGFDVDKAQNTLNALSEKYGVPIYIYSFQNPTTIRENDDATMTVSSGFYCNNYPPSGNNEGQGKISPYLPFDIGEGANYAGNNKLPSCVGKLLELADGNLSKDIGEPYNPLEPTPENDGIVNFTIGSNGIGSGYNQYKLKWNVSQDSTTLNFAEVECHVGFMLNLDTYRDFKKVTIGSGGSFDFSFQQALAHCEGWSLLDKIKEKLPILDPSPIRMFIEFFVGGNQIETGAHTLIASLNYNGSVSLETPTTVYDAFGNSFSLDGGNAEDEDTKSDMDNDDVTKDDDETGDGDNKIYTGGTDSVNGSALLTTSYALTIQQIHSFGSWLWGGTLVDDIQLVNNNPVENIVSAKLFPFSVSGTESVVQLGNVTSNVNGQKLAENVARTFTFGGTVTVPKYYSLSSNYGGRYAFLDYAPYTKIQIYLPYIGLKELDPSVIMDNPLNVKYYVDLVTGMCRCVLQSSKRNLYIFDGQIGQDIPITSSNRAQVEVGYITGGLQTITNVLSGNLFGALSSAISTASTQYHSETSGVPTPCNSRFDSQMAYIIVDRPDVPSIPTSFEHQNGRICNLTKTISSLSGYVEVDNTVDLSGIQCLESEREEILSLLSSGFYV